MSCFYCPVHSGNTVKIWHWRCRQGKYSNAKLDKTRLCNIRIKMFDHKYISPVMSEIPEMIKRWVCLDMVDIYPNISYTRAQRAYSRKLRCRAWATLDGVLVHRRAHTAQSASVPGHMFVHGMQSEQTEIQGCKSDLQPGRWEVRVLPTEPLCRLSLGLPFKIIKIYIIKSTTVNHISTII